MEQEEQMKICACHKKQIPLLWTFAFHGAEYWCPACGYTGGMFGAGLNIAVTEELEKLKEKYKEKSGEYLTAVSEGRASDVKWEYEL